MEKMTNKKALEFVLGLEVVVDNEEVFAKLTKMLEQVEKKNGTSKNGEKVLSAEQKLNEKLKERILEVLSESDKPLQIKDLATFEGLDYSGQKLSALVRMLIKDELVVRIEEKKVAKFKIAE